MVVQDITIVDLGAPEVTNGLPISKNRLDILAVRLKECSGSLLIFSLKTGQALHSPTGTTITKYPTCKETPRCSHPTLKVGNQHNTSLFQTQLFKMYTFLANNFSGECSLEASKTIVQNYHLISSSTFTPNMSSMARM